MRPAHAEISTAGVIIDVSTPSSWHGVILLTCGVRRAMCDGLRATCDVRCGVLRAVLACGAECDGTCDCAVRWCGWVTE